MTNQITNEVALPTFRLGAGTVIAQANIQDGGSVTRSSPALSVMTDLTKVRAAVTPPSTSLREAEQLMIQQGVRMLFVVSASSTFEGLITSTDLRGEKQMRLVAQRGVHYDELTVGDVMTDLASLDAIDLELMKRATVGDVIATLGKFGRDHLLVVERNKATNECGVRGIVSRAQIERQSGLKLATARIASTFAEVERALF
jgi:signal-transduction protein with cAMP-binding, CBS, and nucleotidyltransferase domain